MGWGHSVPRAQFVPNAFEKTALKDHLAVPIVRMPRTGLVATIVRRLGPEAGCSRTLSSRLNWRLQLGRLSFLPITSSNCGLSGLLHV